MTKPREFGDELERAIAITRQGRQRAHAQNEAPPIPIRRWSRNPKHPNAWLVNAMGEALNQAGMHRTKEVFRNQFEPNWALNMLSSATPLPRYRFAFHTHPLTHNLMVVATMFPPSNSAAASAADSYATLEISNTAGAIVGSEEFHYGVSPTGTGSIRSTWQYHKTIIKRIAVDPDTDYTGFFEDNNYGRLAGACVFELTSLTNYGGYMPQNLPAGAPVLATDRQKLMQLARLLWKRGGSQVLNWSFNKGYDPQTTTSSTQTNIVDNTSTAVSAATPGFTLDMRYKDRVSQTSGVPCVMKVYGLVSGATLDGNVYLKDSTGATVASITGQWSTITGAGWASVSFNLPATLAKYDLHFSRTTGGQTFNLYAVSIYEHEA